MGQTFFVDELIEYKLNKSNYCVFKRWMHLYQFDHRYPKDNSGVFGCLWHYFRSFVWIVMQPFLHHLSGADWRMIHGSCLLCSMSFLLHRERAVWSAGFGVEGFCFPLVLKLQICSVKFLWQQRLHMRCILFLEGEISFEMLLTSSRSSQESCLAAVSLSDRSCNFDGIIRANILTAKKCPFVSIVFHLGN